MFEYHENKLCVQAGWLIEEAQVITLNNYRNLTRRDHIQVLRRGCKGVAALVEWASLPERFRTPIIEMVGDPVKTAKHTNFIDFLERDTAAIAFYSNYTLDNGEALPDKNIREYVANATLLNAIRQLVNDQNARRKALGANPSGKVWHLLAEVIQELPVHTWPHSLPKNVQSLKRREKKYREEGYESLIHGSFCNSNSEKINDDARMWLLMRWADRVRKVPSITHMLREYNAKAELEDWKPLEDDKTIRNYLYSPEVKYLWYGHRYGEGKAKEKFTHHLKTKMPSMRDSLWYSDGTKMNYYFLDEDGKIATCQVYEVMDVYSEVLLGFHISKSEDFEAQYNAYKMAAQVSGHRPYEIGFDNQGGHKKLVAGNFLTKLARLSVKAQPYNGKSKTIESAFKRFQEGYLKKDWFFTGMNIQSKKLESKANMEFIMANKANLPTLAEVKKIYEQRRMEWNSAAHYESGQPRVNMYRESENPKAPELNMFEMVDLFWIQRPDAVTCTSTGISFKEKGNVYEYMVYKNQMPDLDWLDTSIDRKFHIKYDPDDRTLIYLYEMDALGLRFVTEATIKIETHRAKQEQEGWETSYIHKVIEANKVQRVKTRDKMDAILAEHNALPEDYGLNSPALRGIESQKKKNARNKVKPTRDYDKVVSNMDEGDEDVFNGY